MTGLGTTIVELAGGPMNRGRYIAAFFFLFFVLGFLQAVLIRYDLLEGTSMSPENLDTLTDWIAAIFLATFSVQRAAHMKWPLLCSVLAWAPVTWIVFFPAFCIIPGNEEPWISKTSMIYRICAKVRK